MMLTKTVGRIALRKALWVAALVPAALAGSPNTATAGIVTQSFTFDASNVFSPGNYGTVLVEALSPGTTSATDSLGLTLSSGQVRFIVTASPTPYTSVGTNFRVDKFAFNTDLSILASAISVTDKNGVDQGASISFNKNVSSFGEFDIQEDTGGGGNSGLNPTVVTISGLGSNATIDHFVFQSTGMGGFTSAFFVAHIADFTLNGQTSQFAGVTNGQPGGGLTGVPEPSSLLLMGLSSAGLGLFGLRRRVRTAN